MKFDRNSIMGFVILGILFVDYFIYTSNAAKKTQKLRMEQAAKEKAYNDSVARTHDSMDLVKNPKRDSINHAQESIAALANKGVFNHTGDSLVRPLVIDNDLMRVTFTNKGGQIRKVELKK